MHKWLPADRWLALGAVAAVLLGATPERVIAQDAADEQGTLQGVIVDEGNGEALGGALLRIEGRNRAVLANQDGRFRVQLDNGHEIVAYTAGRMKRNRIKTIAGDRVTVEMTSLLGTAGEDFASILTSTRMGTQRRRCPSESRFTS